MKARKQTAAIENNIDKLVKISTFMLRRHKLLATYETLFKVSRLKISQTSTFIHHTFA